VELKETREERLRKKRNEQEEALPTQRDDVAYVEPKVLVPFIPQPGRLPRAIVVTRMIKLYKSFQIEDLLDDEGVDFRNPKSSTAAWLPLDPYDDTEFECRNPQEWIQLGHQNTQFKPILAKVQQINISFIS
jgi:hypothetical protein